MAKIMMDLDGQSYYEYECCLNIIGSIMLVDDGMTIKLL